MPCSANLISSQEIDRTTLLAVNLSAEFVLSKCHAEMQLWPLSVHSKMYTFMLLDSEGLAAVIGHSLLPELYYWMRETSGKKPIKISNSCHC